VSPFILFFGSRRIFQASTDFLGDYDAIVNAIDNYFCAERESFFVTARNRLAFGKVIA